MRRFESKFGGLSLRVWALLVLMVLFSGAAIAEESNSVATKEVLTTLQQRMRQLVSVDFPDTPIGAAIRAIADMAQVDIIISPKVTGNVTATLTDVPLEEALRNILAAHGYGYVVDENLIRVAPAAEINAAAEVLVNRIYRITYANVTEVEKALDKFKSPRGTVSSNPGTSNVIVTDTESRIKAIDTFIQEIDRITPQILVEVRIYDITSRDTLDLGVEWQGGRNTIIGSTTLGANPTAGNRRPFATGTFSADTDKTSDDFIGNLRIGWLSGGLDIDAVIRAQEEKADAKLLANPRILVLDNQAALFDIVTEIPYAEASFTGVTTTETIKFKNVGVKLAVTPHLTREGMLRLHIMPEFSVVVRTEKFVTSNVPVVDTRKVNTIALVQDGQTVVLGGLRKKDVSKQINKVPLLGDLPLLGALFRFEGENTVITELVVFITPKVVEQPLELSAIERQAYGETQFKGPLPDYTRAEKNNEK